MKIFLGLVLCIALANAADHETLWAEFKVPTNKIYQIVFSNSFQHYSFSSKTFPKHTKV